VGNAVYNADQSGFGLTEILVTPMRDSDFQNCSQSILACAGWQKDSMFEEQYFIPGKEAGSE